jgi:predicted phosphohydrolase
MARVFALADLHLSQAGTKPMDLFGELWRGHPAKMAACWDRLVASEDTVLLPGDISWARTADEAKLDMQWIASRPGRKILLRGNHDGWWSSMAKVRRLLPERCDALHNNAFDLGDRVLVGARGWLAPDDPLAGENDARIFRRELERLKLSIRTADEAFGRDLPRIAMLHYPPWLLGREPTAVVEELKRGGVSMVVYGHLHGEDHAIAVRGEHEGLHYHFVAADAVEFAPVEIALSGPDSSEARA